MPICITCHKPKDDGEFRVNSIRSHGVGAYRKGALRKQCKACDGQDCVRWMRDHPERTMLIAVRTRAKRLKIPCTISVLDITIPKFCPVFKQRLERGTRESHDWAPSLDRKRPELGYIPGNVQVISNKANRLKSDASVAELKRLIAFMRKTEL